MSEEYALHWEREGVNTFSTHIRNLSVYQNIRRLLGTAMKNMSCALLEKDMFTVVDYGTADGANFLTLLQIIKDQVSKKFGDGKQISVQLNDLPSNDFKSVWNNIGDIEGDKGMYFAAVAQSFFIQCFPSNSVHLGFATAATHHIQRLDNLEVKGTICPTTVQDDKAKSLIASAVETEWQEFLLLRSEELTSGGILLCSCLGTDDEDDKLWQQALFGPMDSVWEMLYKDGHITQNEMEAGFIPTIVRRESEHKKPFLDPNSAVSKSGLELIHFEKLRCSWIEYYKHIYAEKVTKENQSDILKELAQIRTSCIKAVYYPHIYRCLHTDRSEAGRKHIMDIFFERIAKHFSSSAIWLDFPDDNVFHVMIIKKN